MRALAEDREVFWLFSEAAGLVSDLVNVSGLPEVPGRHGVLGWSGSTARRFPLDCLR